ncbi:MoaD/ThiS family protein [Alkaliphilus peptidifermentans]|uniref:Molybdopterin synthase sulfur carrier subunit n=1 Tax=Alkaliphilus peptidifermentans DSM 18978 TaxID=1120976 RepID=A0A1G5CUH9_9FIRM|nr:MoaD/ThiS family protein [Alkaliphilus peptidifermentans]SCY05908.1 molybdopterin synthase sulfur carrier subunit [Alkaliphilus peptidifermentans DSM 18978]
MITVSVQMMGIFKNYISEEERYISLKDGSTIMDLLEELSKKCNHEFRKDVVEKISTSECLQSLIFINNRNLVFEKGIDTQMEDGDKIMFLPPMGGG